MSIKACVIIIISVSVLQALQPTARVDKSLGICYLRRHLLKVTPLYFFLYFCEVMIDTIV